MYTIRFKDYTEIERGPRPEWYRVEMRFHVSPHISHRTDKYGCGSETWNG